MKQIDFSTYGLDKNILKALEQLEYHTPTEVQQKVIPHVMKNEDVVVKSKTGSGKTASFAIPICQKIKLDEKQAQALVLTPTRELAVQIKEDIAYIGRFKKIRCASIVGRQSMEAQKIELKQRIHVIVATPGRMIDHIKRGHVNLENIKYLILDEADEMLSRGFIDQVESIIKELPSKRSTLLFSATMPEQIKFICGEYMNNPQQIEVAIEEDETIQIEQSHYKIDGQKRKILEEIFFIEKPKRAIIFCNTREVVEKMTGFMKSKGYGAIGLHGGMEQKKRLDTINKFKNGNIKFLVATDVAARGIHINDVTHVINYEMPSEVENYVHRIGRTGRAGNQGKAISLVENKDEEVLQQIETYLNKKIDEKRRPTPKEKERGKKEFLQSLKAPLKVEKNRSRELNKDITKIRINAGKKRKLRTGDILGALMSIDGVQSEDIGIIDIQTTCSYIEIFGKKGNLVYEKLQNTPIKGKIFTMKKVKIR